MQILTLNFLLYAASGMWRPVEWSSISATLLYGMYTVLMLYAMTFLVLSQFLDLVLVIDNVDDFSANFMLFISVVSVCVKVFITLTRRGRIIEVVEMLQQPPCTICDKEEMDIQTKFNRIIRSFSLTYLSLVACSCTGGFAGGVLTMLQGELPFRAWVPYDYSSPALFWLTSAHLIIAFCFATMINISNDTSVYGICLQTCAQLEILMYRLQKTANSSPKLEAGESTSSGTTGPSRSNRLSAHVCHHLCIIRYAKLVNDLYSPVFFVQFFVSILALCSSLYFLSSHLTFGDGAFLVIYTLSMFVQIFVYCWAGNEVMLKSVNLSDAIYQMDWILMTISERKDLLMIMKRSMKPIKFTSSFLVTLSLSSYASLLKASYSAFNVMQQS